jgi:uncharacterized membrane protein YdbT with pleckstrin-like domain
MNKNKATNPYSKYKFPGQHEGEEIKLIIRKHKIVLLTYVLHIILMSLLPVIFYLFVIPQTFSAFLESPYNNLFILLCVIYYGFIWIIVFTVWVDYYLDIWIITNERLLDVEQKGFFNRVVSELDFKRIQDITSEVHGLLPTMFGFGNIHIQTAAEERKFDLKSIPHPVTVRRKITELYRAAKEKDRLVFRER